MRLIDIIDNMIPRGLAWSYLRTFVKVFIHMLGGTIVFVSLVFSAVLPVAVAIAYESAAYVFCYLITIPSVVVTIKFIAYNLRWNEIF